MKSCVRSGDAGVPRAGCLRSSVIPALALGHILLWSDPAATLTRVIPAASVRSKRRGMIRHYGLRGPFSDTGH